MKLKKIMTWTTLVAVVAAIAATMVSTVPAHADLTGPKPPTTLVN